MKLYIYTLTVNISYTLKQNVHLISDKNNDIKNEQENDFCKYISNKLHSLYKKKYNEKVGNCTINCKTIDFEHYLTWKFQDDTNNKQNHFIQ